MLVYVSLCLLFYVRCYMIVVWLSYDCYHMILLYHNCFRTPSARLLTEPWRVCCFNLFNPCLPESPAADAAKCCNDKLSDTGEFYIAMSN